jgi:hypothetical protein
MHRVMHGIFLRADRAGVDRARSTIRHGAWGIYSNIYILDMRVRWK